MKEGFAPANMPNSNIIENMKWDTKNELLETLSANSRKHIKREAFKYENSFEIEYKKDLTEEETEYYYSLYLEVGQRNRGFNMFDYPQF